LIAISLRALLVFAWKKQSHAKAQKYAKKNKAPNAKSGVIANRLDEVGWLSDTL